MEFRKEWVLPSTIGIASFVAGATAGYIWGKHKAQHVTIYNVSAETGPEPEMTEEEQEHTRILTEYDGAFDPKVVVDEEDMPRDPIAEQQAIEETVMEERAAIELENIRKTKAAGAGKFNIFEGKEDDWDYEVEVPLRSPVKPYIIHRDEFEANEMGFSQSNLSYYALDDILCDDKDVPIYNYHNIVGTLEFGKGSMDISICYVRNEKLGSEWEIIIDHGSYQVEVLGERVEEAFEESDIKHSRSPRRMRSEE